MKLIRTAVVIAAAVAAVNKAKEYARDNPDAASGTIDKAESFVRDKAGPKYADTIGKGSQAVRQGLGLPRATPSSTNATSTTNTTSSATTPTATPGASAPTDGGGAGRASGGFDPAI